MSEAQFKSFLEAVKVDSALQEKLSSALDYDSIAAIAREAGFSISVDDLNKIHEELSDGDLEQMSGGYTPVVLVTAELTIGVVTAVFCRK